MRRLGSCDLVRRLASAATWVGVVICCTPSFAADEWGGSALLTSDYLVRGISRTSHDPAAQFEGHYAGPGGLIAGAFASNARIDPNDPTDVELSAYLGYAWSFAADWRGKVVASHYAYPWNNEGSNYNYDELDFDLVFNGWLRFGLNYSPNSPRYLRAPYRKLYAASEKSAEVGLQRPIRGKLSVTAGVGYSVLSGPDSGGYTYWSIGGAYDWRSFSLAVSYVNTTAEAKALFYNAAADSLFMGTVIWRF